jgi:glycosyltransferase involved in cell wall biosynthesis
LYCTWNLLRSRRITTVCVGLLDMSAMYLLAVRPMLRFRLVTYLHGAEIRDLPRTSAAFGRLVDRCVRSSDAVVAVSRSLADEAMSGFPAVRDKLEIVPNGIDLGQVARAPARRRHRPYIVYVGRLAPDKNVGLIVEAFAKAAQRIPEVDLLLVGAGPDREELARLARSRGIASDRIDFVGAVERGEAFGLIKGALFVVLASHAESHPIVVLEAFGAGKAAIAPRVAGMQEMIEDGINGAFFPPGDAAAFAELMVRYATDHHARATIERNITRADWSRFDIHALAGVHERILEGRP